MVCGCCTVALDEQTDLSINQHSPSAVIHHFCLRMDLDLRTGNAFVKKHIFCSQAAATDSTALLQNKARSLQSLQSDSLISLNIYASLSTSLVPHVHNAALSLFRNAILSHVQAVKAMRWMFKMMLPPAAFLSVKAARDPGGRSMYEPRHSKHALVHPQFSAIRRPNLSFK